MYEIQVSGDEVRVKNGAGGWSQPVVYGGRLYPSTKALAEKHDRRGAQVSTCIRSGHKFLGKSVRKATEDEVRAKLKINDQEDAAFAFRVGDDGCVEVKGGNGRWCRSVVYKDRFYDNACTIDGLSKSIAYAILNNGGDNELGYAKRADIPDGGIEVHAPKTRKNKKRDAAVKREAAKKKGGENDAGHPFMGVTWPDGTVEVRLVSGGLTMVRSRMDEIPAEILGACSWMK